MKSMSTLQRLKTHMNKNGTEYYKNVVSETEKILAEQEVQQGTLQAASALERGWKLVKS